MATEEERMSVSAALQRFREIEKLTAEARALEEQQLALLEAQRISSLHNRASNPPLPGSSPTIKEQQQPSPTFQRADTVDEVSVPFGLAHQRVQELERYPSTRDGSDEDSARTPRVVRRSSKGKDLGSLTLSRKSSSGASSEKNARLARTSSEGGSPDSSSVNTPRSARNGDAKAASGGGGPKPASVPASPSALRSVGEVAYAPAVEITSDGVDSGSSVTSQPAAVAAEAGEQQPAPAAATPPESPMSPPREISPVSAKILAAEAGKMHNAKSTYKTPAPGLGGGFGAFDYEPPAPPPERIVGTLVVPAVAALQDSPRRGSVRQLSATFSGPLSLSRTASGASDELPRLRSAVGRSHSADGSGTLDDAADAAASARENRRSSLGAPPTAEQLLVPEAAPEDDNDDFGTFEEAGDGPVAAAEAGPAAGEADEGPGADADGFGTFEEAMPAAEAETIVAAAEPVDDTMARDEEQEFAAFDDAAGGDDDADFGDFDAAPTEAPVSAPAPAVEDPAVDLLSLPADKFEEAARATLTALAGYGVNFPSSNVEAPAAGPEVVDFGELQRAAESRLPMGSALRAGGFVLPATRQPVQALRWRESQAEARLLSHFGLLWVAREAASTEKQRAAEAAARRRRPSSSSIGSGISGTDTPPRSPATALPDAAPPGVDSLFAGYSGPAGPAPAAWSAPSSGRMSPAPGADATDVVLGSAAAAAAEAQQPEKAPVPQPAGSGSMSDMLSPDIATAGSGSIAEGSLGGGEFTPAGPAAMPPRPRVTPKKTPVFATLAGGGASVQKRRLSTFGIAGGAPVSRSSSFKSTPEALTADEAVDSAPAPAPAPVLSVPFVPPPPRGTAREALRLAGGESGPGPAEPAADPFAFSGDADLLSTYSANGGAAFGSYTEITSAARDDDDFDGFVGSGNDHVTHDNSAGGHASGAPPAAFGSALGDPGPSDDTEAVLSSLPDMSFMLDRGRSWPVRGVSVATHG